MHLWNDYEGKTIASTFPLQELLRTEGRSASFRTRDRTGQPAVIRLTEALNDQQQMHARYSAVQAAKDAHLVSIKDFGETEFDGTPLIYLVMEPTQESLADIVRERRLSLEETGEVALSLVSAIGALHERELVHGQVEPASVLAAGEVIKLRSDCVHFAPEGEDGGRARADDVLGLAGVLHRSLTQERLQDASDALALPEPYASIVRNSVRGSWGISEVTAELRRFVRPSTPVASSQPTPSPSPAPAPSNGSASGRAVPVGSQQPVPAGPANGATGGSGGSSRQPVTAGARSGSEAVAGAAAGLVDRERAVNALAAQAGNEVQPLSSRGSVDAKAARRDRPASNGSQLPMLYEEDGAEATTAAASWDPPADGAKRKSRTYLVAIGFGLLLLVGLLWYFADSRKSVHPGVAGRSAASTVAAPLVTTPASSTMAPAPPVGEAAAPQAAATPATATTSDQAGHAHGTIWRVVAYTYNANSQAQAKAHMIARRHADLHPQVYSPSGHAPYLVTLGGELSREQAAAMKQHARREGLARDVYMQNYSH